MPIDLLEIVAAAQIRRHELQHINSEKGSTAGVLLSAVV
jgi:hypothetical protein